MVISGKLEATPLQEVIQVIAYSQQSGVLTVNGPSATGSVLFSKGGVVCAHTASTRCLLAKAAEETEPRSRAGLRRISALAALAELFDLKEGLYYFTRTAEPVARLDGVATAAFYASGGMDTGDLLLVLEKTMEGEEPSSGQGQPRGGKPANQRRHPRYGPTLLKARLSKGGSTVKGFLTNLSMGGAFFHAEELPRVDRVYDLYFDLPGELGPCQAIAKVVWARAHATDTSRGVGLSFERLPLDSLQRLTLYLDRFQGLAENMDSEG